MLHLNNYPSLVIAPLLLPREQIRKFSLTHLQPVI